MGFKVSTSGGNDYANPTDGTKAARCIRIVDVGTQTVTWNKEEKLVRKCMFTWETDELMDSGKPFCVQKEYTALVSDRSNLGQDISKWLNKPIADIEAEEEFELFDMLGKTCLITIQNKKGKNGKIYSNVEAVIAKPEAYPDPPEENDYFQFFIDDDLEDSEKIDGLWGLERYKLRLAEEVKAKGTIIPDRPKKEDQQDDGQEKPF